MKCWQIIKSVLKGAGWCILLLGMFVDNFMPTDGRARGTTAFIIHCVIPLYIVYFILLISSGWLKLKEVAFRYQSDYYTIRDELILLYSIILILLCIAIGQYWIVLRH